MATPLANAFFAALDPALRETFARVPDLDARLTAATLAAGPDCGVERLVAAMAARLTSQDADDPERALSAFVMPDLALAVACAAGDSGAIARFEAAYGAQIDRAIRKSPGLGVADDEFRQIIREKLMVSATGTAPRIASYGGRAPLGGWLRATCARAVIDLARLKDGAEVLTPDDAMFDRLPGRHDPEVAALRARYADLLPRAFEAALQTLTPRQRNLLRQRYLHGTPASALASAYGVHRATMFDWLEEAKNTLLQRTRKQLRATVGGATLESVMGIMGSELELSIRGLLGSHVEDEKG